eukprot:gene9239-biopygen12202
MSKQAMPPPTVRYMLDYCARGTAHARSAAVASHPRAVFIIVFDLRRGDAVVLQAKLSGAQLALLLDNAAGTILGETAADVSRTRPLIDFEETDASRTCYQPSEVRAEKCDPGAAKYDLGAEKRDLRDTAPAARDLARGGRAILLK